ncbi:PQQ-binding-like beta-propeller repeat protein [Cellulomonas fimi]|uniref:Pyrrolo-quinoline quinone repeat domain-containing protein n=1 Tax=Cellulomonas fimi (strain ATCC 484 / DSM 20113 / JCM 1341 / CCUG 24087 / LMG 16345 / NBRC 15513 / NCIMB 8980 / NCTC 7547 / NRS-133) TaxID=590998 RepID=F4H2U9_CELFA|nr:PQQ-binding-like beta-propeller repeat protein [Cellulomonas fimi]AEE46448.1 hypothetical protein Celf_2321 [Cellulomonas fimi ATCC 484]NNH07740.1 hypothetical protein [Cellulomonas fimi]VEH33043.1 Uncharacterised protein [Cellulomonas fimi]
MTSTTTPTPATATPLRGREPRWPRVAAVVGAVATGAGWWASETVVYLPGVLLLALGVASLVRTRRRLGVLLGASVLVVGVGVPWLALARTDGGRLVEPVVHPYDEGVTVDTVARVVDSRRVLALDAESGLAWEWTPPDWSTIVGVVLLDAGRLLVAAQTATVLGPDGVAGPDLGTVHPAQVVAADGDVVVLRACDESGPRPAPCTWRGVDATDGSTAWTADGVTSDATVRLATTPRLGAPWPVPPTTAAVASADGVVTVRAASSGRPVLALDPDAGLRVLPVADAVVVASRAGDRCTAAAHDADGDPRWEAEVPCGVLDGLDARVSAFTSVVEVDGTLWTPDGTVVDLATGDVDERGAVTTGRSAPQGHGEDRLVLGSGVQVALSEDALVVTPVRGGDAWSVALDGGEVRTLVADGGLVVVEQYLRPRLLAELVAPGERRRHVVDAYDARTGAHVGRVVSGPQGTDGIVVSAGTAFVVDRGPDGERRVRAIGP